MLKICKLELTDDIYINGELYNKGIHEDVELNLNEIEYVMYYGQGMKVYQKVTTSSGDKYIRLNRNNYRAAIPMDEADGTPTPKPSEEENGDGGETSKSIPLSDATTPTKKDEPEQSPKDTGESQTTPEVSTLNRSAQAPKDTKKK